MNKAPTLAGPSLPGALGASPRVGGEKGSSATTDHDDLALLRALVEGLARWELWATLGWHDIKQRYRRSVIGPSFPRRSRVLRLGMTRDPSTPVPAVGGCGFRLGDRRHRLCGVT